MVNGMVYPNITGTLVTLDDLSPWSNYVCIHNCYQFFEEYPIEVINYGCHRDTNKVVASVKYLWVLATPLSMDLVVG